nr:MAG TPA: hypothetical protein [Caudoviricetes sp.]
MSKEQQLIEWYEEAFDRYGEALQDVVSDYWQNVFGDESWKQFHELDKKIKVKFYVEGEE